MKHCLGVVIWLGSEITEQTDWFSSSHTDLEKAVAPHSSTAAWKIPWTEEPGGLQSMGSLRVGHNWATSLSLFTFMHWRRQWQPTPGFLPGESQGRGSQVGCRLWGRTESDRTEATQQQQKGTGDFSWSCVQIAGTLFLVLFLFNFFFLIFNSWLRWVFIASQAALPLLRLGLPLWRLLRRRARAQGAGLQ